MNKEPGDWYGVNSIAQVLTSLFSSSNKKIKHMLSVLNFSEGHLQSAFNLPLLSKVAWVV